MSLGVAEESSCDLPLLDDGKPAYGDACAARSIPSGVLDAITPATTPHRRARVASHIELKDASYRSPARRCSYELQPFGARGCGAGRDERCIPLTVLCVARERSSTRRVVLASRRNRPAGPVADKVDSALRMQLVARHRFGLFARCIAWVVRGAAGAAGVSVMAV